MEEILSIRKQIHRHPETGNREYKTAELAETFLRGLGIETERYLETAVVGTLRCGGGPVIALRADMDALPVTEKTDCDFASLEPGLMHACGHDVHTAAVLGAAKALAAMKDELHGTVKFIFQPDEEGDGGAKRIIAEGVMESVDAVFGAHVDPSLPEGAIGIRYGKFYAASDMFDVTITGVSAHGATPEKGVDALAAAAEAVLALRKIPAGMEDRCVVTTGMLHAGTARNILSDKAEFRGIIRSLGNENRKELRALTEKTIRDISDTYGAGCEIRFRESYMGIVNTDRETAIAEKAAETVGKRVRIEEPLMTTEDFGYYIEACGGGAFYHIGAGCERPLHSPEFLPTDGALATAVRMHTETVRLALQAFANK